MNQTGDQQHQHGRRAEGEDATEKDQLPPQTVGLLLDDYSHIAPYRCRADSPARKTPL